MNGRSCVFFILSLLLACVIFTQPVAAYQFDISAWINSYSHVVNFGNDPGTHSIFASTLDYTNETIIIDNDLKVDHGTSISMNNVTMVMNSTRNGSLKIEVMDGGSLFLNNSSIISKGQAYNIYIYNNGTFGMKNSVLQGCGYQGPDIRSYGLWINSNNNRIESSTLEDCYYGLIFDHSSSNFVINNTIRRNIVGIYINGSMRDTIGENRIYDNVEGGLIESSRINIISDNVIINNTDHGLAIGPSSDVNFLTNNTVSDNGQGITLNSSISNSMVRNDLYRNAGPAIRLESSQINFIGNNTLTSNGYGLYLNASNENVLSDNNASYNHADGIYLGESSNNYIANNNASYNGGFGFNVSDTSQRTFISRSNNVAIGNGKGDIKISQGALTVLEVSLLSIVFAFADKILYLVDFQKVIITNIFSGMVNPIRDPLRGGLEKAINRVYELLGIKRWNYKNSHISQRLGFLFMHFIDGDEIRSVVYLKPHPGILSNELILAQIRFIDILVRDRKVLQRNLVYFTLMTIIGLFVYYCQVVVGTFKWPYLLPIVIQFSIMFIIGLIIQSSIVGKTQRIKYDIQPCESLDGPRREIRIARDIVEDHHDDGKINDRKYDDEMDRLRWMTGVVEYLDVRKEYLRFTTEGYKRAIEGYQWLLKDDPDNPFYLAGLGEAYTMLGRWKEENEEDPRQYYKQGLNAAIKSSDIDDGIVESHRAMALALYFSGKRDEADIELKAALEVNGRDAESYHLLAMMKPDMDSRARLLYRSVNMDQDLIIARRDLGITLIEQGKLEKAAQQFAYVLKHYHTDPVAHRYMGYIYDKQGKKDKAIAEYRRALELYPGYKGALTGMKEAEKTGVNSAIVEDTITGEGNKVG